MSGASEKAYETAARLDNIVSTATDWIDFGAMANSWSKASNPCHYRRLIGGAVYIEMQNITPGTTANGTTIISSANGLPAGFRPGHALWIPVRQDNVATQTAAVCINTDGHLECWGVGSATRWDVNVNFYAEL
jgi:hypothetical protein